MPEPRHIDLMDGGGGGGGDLSDILLLSLGFSIQKSLHQSRLERIDRTTMTNLFYPLVCSNVQMKYQVTCLSSAVFQLRLSLFGFIFVANLWTSYHSAYTSLPNDRLQLRYRTSSILSLCLPKHHAMKTYWEVEM